MTETPAVALGVAQLVDRLKRVVEGRFGDVVVDGEVSGYKRAASGHVYFDLVEGNVKLPAVWFKGRMRGGPPAFLQAGNRVRVHGDCTLYPARANYQVLVRRVEPAGVGDLLAALEALKARLRAEGLFDPTRRKPLPFLPRRVGVVTSPTGAAIRDILRTLARRYPIPVVLAPAMVQGERAPAEIVRGIRALDRIADVDVIIVGRGGGSLEDLFSFNDEAVVRAVAAARTPVVSAVGHEPDSVLSDLAADRRVATPTAAAEAVVPNHAELLHHVGQMRLRAARAARARIDRSRQALAVSRGRLRDPETALRLSQQRLDEQVVRLEAAARRSLRERRAALALRRQQLLGLHPARRIDMDRRQLRGLHDRLMRTGLRSVGPRAERLGALERRLRALSPEAHLERGYSLVRASGRLVREAAALDAGDRVEIVLWRGVLDATVEGHRAGPFDGGEEAP